MMVARKSFWCLFSMILAAMALCSHLVGCSNTGTADEATTPGNPVVTTTPTPPPVDTIKAAALEYCNCFKQTMGRFDPRVEALIIQSVEQPKPMQFLEQEIAKMSDPASQQQAIKDLETFSNFDAASPCISSVSRKYGVDENNPATLQRIVAALAGYPDCRLVTALFKVAYSENSSE